MNRLKFSIVTISYNAENEIEETIQSVLIQKYRPMEYIFVDGKSTDKTTEIINRFIPILQAAGICVKYLSERDNGISDAFNKGINLAEGDIIGLINAGDTLLPEALQIVMENIKRDTDIIYGNTLLVDKKNNISYLRAKPDHVDYSKFASKGLVFTHQSAFVKRKMYEEVGLYDLEFDIIMDTELFIRFYRYGAKFQYIDYTIVSMLAGGISARPSKRIYQEHIEIGKRYGGVNRYRLLLHYICDIPISAVKKYLKVHHKSLWYILLGKKRSVQG